MKKLMKRLLTIGMSFALLSILFVSYSFAEPSGSSSWQGDVDFWESQVGNAKKEYSGKSYEAFYGNAGSDSFYIYLTVKKNSGNDIVTDKTKFSKGQESYLNTRATVGGDYKLIAAREYILDIKTNCWGDWRP